MDDKGCLYTIPYGSNSTLWKMLVYIYILSLDVRRRSSRHHWASAKVHGVCGTMVGQAGGVLEGILGAWCE